MLKIFVLTYNKGWQTDKHRDIFLKERFLKYIIFGFVAMVAPTHSLVNFQLKSFRKQRRTLFTTLTYMVEHYAFLVIEKARINGFNIWPTSVQQKLNGCWANVKRSVQTASTPLNVFENKGNVVWMLNESLNQFKFASTRFHQAFNICYTFNNFKRPVQTPLTFGSTKCWMHVEANVETV